MTSLIQIAGHNIQRHFVSQCLQARSGLPSSLHAVCCGGRKSTSIKQSIPTMKLTGNSSTGLPLASILKRSLGLPATTFRGSPGSLKGSGLIQNGSCAEVFCFAYDALCSFYNQFCQTVSLSVVHSVSGMLVHHSSNRFTERPILVVLHVSSAVWWLAALPDVFY